MHVQFFPNKEAESTIQSIVLEVNGSGNQCWNNKVADLLIQLFLLSVVRDFQEYVEPGEDFPASPQRRNTSLQEDKDDSVILPLGADTLTCNLGIPVVVVCTKVCFTF